MGPTSGSAHKPYLGSDENCLTRKKEKDSEIHGRQDRGVSIDCCDTDLCNMPVTMTTTTTTTTENPTLAPTPRTTHRPAPVSIHPTMGHIPTTSIYSNGKSNMLSETVKQGKALHTISHDVITVFVGTEPDMHELQTIATDQHNVFTLHNIPLLSSLQSQIHHLICNG
ncbi:hypothetical protein MAR_019975 [Mya arenaria]|uniref:Uncharacterized protein n=1 Tax=Mya arenaria TaxID=6604 RepID=A0ABY7E7S9_MYAAR|nr:hypothetical protein MAR_019975 [Mya arenaria]